jgi:hypothetical protein
MGNAPALIEYPQVPVLITVTALEAGFFGSDSFPLQKVRSG